MLDFLRIVSSGEEGGGGAGDQFVAAFIFQEELI